MGRAFLLALLLAAVLLSGCIEVPDCEQYCEKEAPAECEGQWKATGFYPNCKCEWECTVKEECVKEGGTIPVIEKPPECCGGLTLIPPKEEGIAGIQGYCTAKCGNGKCDEIESSCNCPQDCEGKEIIPVPTVEVFEIAGGECPIPGEGEREFALPAGCTLLEETGHYDFAEIDLVCEDDALLDLGCYYVDGNEERHSGGKLVKTALTGKTLIECQVFDYYPERGKYIRAFDYHPGPYIMSFYAAYDAATKEFTKITSWQELFYFLAPMDSAEKVWGTIRLAMADDIYCRFKSRGYPPWPPEGSEYDEEVWTFEEFLVPKESIMVSSVVQTANGFKAHVLAERQGCPCFTDFFEFDLEVSRNGKISKGADKPVYSAVEGCIC